MKPLLVLLVASAPTLLLAANAPVPAQFPSDSGVRSPKVPAGPAQDPSVRSAELPAAPAQFPSDSSARSPELPATAPNVQKQDGKVDAPVDGLDGKPHDGPGLFETKAKGSGDVGISGGKHSIDLKKPPPHTGEHEIVSVEDPQDEDGSLQVDSPDTTGDGKLEDPNKSSGGPVSDHEHKEYTPAGTDTLKDPPVKPPQHLGDLDSQQDASTMSQPMHSFTLSFIMIIFSEIGDKTFLIAALMAMKNPRLLVFTAALSSLIVMSILSAVLGHAVPTLIPKKLTAFLAAGLFLVFGARMVREGLTLEKGTANVQEEMAEVEAELQKKSRDRASSIHKLESGTMRSHSLRRNTSSPSLSDSDEDDYASVRGVNKKKMTSLEGIQNLAGLLLSPAWVQTFVMTFLGEWGDRSQIATIAMAAGQDYWYVTVGAISGHAICTCIAVVGGRMLASRISVRNVTLGGAVAFLVFGLLYLGEALYI